MVSHCGMRNGQRDAGRLNVLANVVRKPMQQIFSEFTGIKSGDQDSFTGSGDVKYHLGTSYDRPTITGKRVHLSLLANPSHLEVCLHAQAHRYYAAILVSWVPLGSTIRIDPMQPRIYAYAFI